MEDKVKICRLKDIFLEDGSIEAAETEIFPKNSFGLPDDYTVLWTESENITALKVKVEGGKYGLLGIGRPTPELVSAIKEKLDNEISKTR